MLEPEEYIHMGYMAYGSFCNRHVLLQTMLSTGVSTHSEQSRQAVRILAAINALRMVLTEYERDMLDPILAGDEAEQLI